VHLLVAIEMDRPVEAFVRLIKIDLLFEQQRVGADGDELTLGERAVDDLGQLLVKQGLAARHDDDGRAAFIHRMESVGHRDPLVQDLVGIIDLATARACEVAAKERLQHQHERIPLAARQVLLQYVSTDRQCLV
jgi:hypothetical protein